MEKLCWKVELISGVTGEIKSHVTMPTINAKDLLSAAIDVYCQFDESDLGLSQFEVSIPSDDDTDIVFLRDCIAMHDELFCAYDEEDLFESWIIIELRRALREYIGYMVVNHPNKIKVEL